MEIYVFKFAVFLTKPVIYKGKADASLSTKCGAFITMSNAAITHLETRSRCCVLALNKTVYYGLQQSYYYW